jgi:hypothetical protein
MQLVNNILVPTREVVEFLKRVVHAFQTADFVIAAVDTTTNLASTLQLALSDSVLGTVQRAVSAVNSTAHRVNYVIGEFTNVTALLGLARVKVPAVRDALAFLQTALDVAAVMDDLCKAPGELLALLTAPDSVAQAASSIHLTLGAVEAANIAKLIGAPDGGIPVAVEALALLDVRVNTAIVFLEQTQADAPGFGGGFKPGSQPWASAAEAVLVDGVLAALAPAASVDPDVFLPIRNHAEVVTSLPRAIPIETLVCDAAGLTSTFLDTVSSAIGFFTNLGLVNGSTGAGGAIPGSPQLHPGDLVQGITAGTIAVDSLLALVDDATAKVVALVQGPGSPVLTLETLSANATNLVSDFLGQGSAVLVRVATDLSQTVRGFISTFEAKALNLTLGICNTLTPVMGHVESIVRFANDTVLSPLHEHLLTFRGFLEEYLGPDSLFRVLAEFASQVLTMLAEYIDSKPVNTILTKVRR